MIVSFLTHRAAAALHLCRFSRARAIVTSSTTLVCFTNRVPRACCRVRDGQGKLETEHETRDAMDTPTKGGVHPDPMYHAANRLFSLARVSVRQHTPSVGLDIVYLLDEDNDDDDAA